MKTAGFLKSDVKWKDSFRFLPARIFGITSGSGPLRYVGLVGPKFEKLVDYRTSLLLFKEFGKGMQKARVRFPLGTLHFRYGYW